MLSQVIITVGAIGILGLLLRIYNAVVAKPAKLRSALRKQGVSGPPPCFLLGNILDIKKARDAAAKTTTNSSIPTHNCGAAVLPFFDKWRQQYGDVLLFSLGNTQILHVTQPEMVREITTCTLLELGKPTYQAKERGALLGNGILTSNGHVWARQRKILAPELYMDKVKGMTRLIQECAIALVESWATKIEAEGGNAADIKIEADLRSFSGDVISKACFGSSFSKGEQIFSKLRALQESASRNALFTGIPGIRHLPTRGNREAWRIEKEIKSLILKIVQERREGGDDDKDVLQMIIEGAKHSEDLKNDAIIDDFIVDNCKNIYLAGYETTAVSAAWCLMLLAANPLWQHRIRAAVVHVCQGQIPDHHIIPKMKLLTMAISESLRLYPPVAVVSREALQDMRFGEINIPKGVSLWVPVTTLHTDPQIWGPDSYEYNPERFANGVNGACKLPHLYMPFGVGPRVCLGQHLAMAELKILIALILSNFSFSLSPNYIHSPTLNLVIEPGHGVRLLVNKL